MNDNGMLLDIDQHIDISRAPAEVFDGLLRELSQGMQYEDGRSMNMHLEAWPGGRWYRDLGNNSGHFWGVVQALKPPALLEINGPMFMSYPAMNHLEFKLAEADGGTRLTLRHRAIGMLDEAHRTGVRDGWRGMLEAIKKNIES